MWDSGITPHGHLDQGRRRRIIPKTAFPAMRMSTSTANPGNLHQHHPPFNVYPLEFCLEFLGRGVANVAFGNPRLLGFSTPPAPEAFHSRLWALIPCRNIPRAGSISLASLGSWLCIPHPSWNQWKADLNSLFPQNHRHPIPPNSQIRIFQQREDPERLGSLSSFFLV